LEGKIVGIIKGKDGSSNLEEGVFTDVNGFGFVTPKD
jgi:hypothetical protein